MNKEEYKRQIKQKFTERNLNGFANHTILADLMADICIEVVKENCNLQNVSNRCIYTELETIGYSEQQILELLGFMENLPIHQTTEDAKKVSVVLAKGHVVII